jgi:two-component system, OmpR family, KDP operon response regulator KdpE
MPTDATSSAPKTILIVDDEEVIVRWLSRSLAAAGYVAISASDAAEAQRALVMNRIDAVILDITLRDGQSGLDVLDVIRGDVIYSNLPTLILTGSQLSETQEERIVRHKPFVFYKPSGANELIRKLDHLLGSHPHPRGGASQEPDSQ